MKKILLATLVPVLFFSCNEPEKNPAGNDTPSKSQSPVKVLPPVTHYTVPDRSPMDMVYFPNDYPLLKMAGKTSALPLMRIIYSRPQKQGRPIFGGLVKYDVPWRLGANEATEIEFFSTATVEGKTVKAADSFLRAFFGCHFYETKTLGATSVTVGYESNIGYITSLSKQFTDGFLSGGVGEIADIQLLSHCHRLLSKHT